METYLKTFDKQGVFLRNIAPTEPLLGHEYLHGVSCIVDVDGSIIFEQKAPTRDGGGLLDFCSGHINNSETPQEAMIRELSEELNIPREIADNIIQIGHYSTVIQKRQVHKNWIITLFHLKIPNDTVLTPQDAEIANLILLPIDQAINCIQTDPKFQYPYDENLQKALSYIIREHA